MDTDRFPGGLSVWRARWFLLWFRGQLVRRGLRRLLVVGLPVVAGLIAWSIGHHTTATVVAVVVVGAIAGLFWPNASRRFRWGSAVTEQTQPTLYALVERVAAILDAPMPDRVWLVHEPMVRVEYVGGRRHLWIGLCLVCCLGRSQLEALVAHEIVLLRHRRVGLLLRLRLAWMQEKSDWYERGDRAERNLALLDDFWSTVDNESDAAAIRLIGTDAAAEALAMVGLVAWEFAEYSSDNDAPVTNAGIQDLFEAWPLFVEQGRSDRADEGKHEFYVLWHTALDGPVSRVGALRMRVADDRVALAPLTGTDQRLLVRYAQDLPAHRSIRWETFATAPPQWWLMQAEFDVELVRRRVKAPDDADLLEVLEAGNLRAYTRWRLMEAGWRIERPPLWRFVVSPTGEGVDLIGLTDPEMRTLARSAGPVVDLA